MGVSSVYYYSLNLSNARDFGVVYLLDCVNIIVVRVNVYFS